MVFLEILFDTMLLPNLRCWNDKRLTTGSEKLDMVCRKTALKAIGFSDHAGVTRVRSFPSHREEAILESGTAWIPGNMCLTSFGNIASTNPAGATGELRMFPDTASAISLPYQYQDEEASAGFYLANICEADGTPWSGCPRSFLTNAVKRLQDKHGITLKVAFEHEFSLINPRQDIVHGFSLQAMMAHKPVMESWAEALDSCNIGLELIIPEYGKGQFEAVIEPESPVKAADNAVILKDIIREVARAQQCPITFAPKPNLYDAGNGVHIHFSLFDRDQTPLVPGDKDSTVGDTAGCFVTGILKELSSLCALGAATVPSYYRLQPNQWAAGRAGFGYRDREAALRLCPGTAKTSIRRQQQANIEYRVADATANPYVLLGALIHAGMKALDEKAGISQPSDNIMAVATPLLTSVEEALEALTSSHFLTEALPEQLLASQVAVKHDEYEQCRKMDQSSIIGAYNVAI